jgi:hypothetical protein
MKAPRNEGSGAPRARDQSAGRAINAKTVHWRKTSRLMRAPSLLPAPGLRDHEAERLRDAPSVTSLDRRSRAV